MEAGASMEEGGGEVGRVPRCPVVLRAETVLEEAGDEGWRVLWYPAVLRAEAVFKALEGIEYREIVKV